MSSTRSFIFKGTGVGTLTPGKKPKNTAAKKQTKLKPTKAIVKPKTKTASKSKTPVKPASVKPRSKSISILDEPVKLATKTVSKSKTPVKPASRSKTPSRTSKSITKASSTSKSKSVNKSITNSTPSKSKSKTPVKSASKKKTVSTTKSISKAKSTSSDPLKDVFGDFFSSIEEQPSLLNKSKSAGRSKTPSKKTISKPSSKPTNSSTPGSGKKTTKRKMETKETSRKVTKVNGNQRFENRTVLADALINNDITIAECSLAALLSNPKYLTPDEKDSGSMSVIIMGELNVRVLSKMNDQFVDRTESNKYNKRLIGKADKNVVVKMSFMPTDENDINGALDVESKIYTQVISNLADWGYTPHVMLPITSYVCENAEDMIENIPKQKDKKIVEDAIDSFKTKLANKNKEGTVDFTRARVLILERGIGTDLYGFLDERLKAGNVNLDLFSVLFQIMWTFEIFNRIGMRHNDAHFGNIWIDELETPQYFFYFLDEKTYFAVPVKYLVKVYDFDHVGIWSKKFTTKDSQGNLIPLTNETLNDWLCSDVGECNDENKKADAYLILYDLWNRYKTNRKIVSWVNKFFPSEGKLLKKTKFPVEGKLCNVVGQGKSKSCDGNWEPSDEEMLPVTEILKKGFKVFQHSLPEFDGTYLNENEYKNLYMLPDTNQRKLDKFLDTRKISNTPLPPPGDVLSQKYMYE